MTDSSEYKSILKHSSELGLWMGLYFILMSCCLLLSVHVSTLLLLLLPLTLGWPVVLRVLLSRICRESPHYRTIPAMWLSGIWICIFGSLICAAFTAAYILLLQPDFLSLYLHQCLQMALTAASAAPEYNSMAADMRSLLDSGQLPSPMQWVFSMIWLSAFAGAVISLIVSLTLKGLRPKIKA